MREAAEISEALIELGAALALQGSVDAVAEMLARAVDRLVESAAISVWLRAGDEMTLAAHAGYTPVEVRRLAAAAGGRDRGAVRGQPRVAHARGVHAQARRRARRATSRPWRPGRPSRSCPSASGPPTGRRSSSSAASAGARPTAATSACCSGSPTRRSWRWSTAALYAELEESFLATVAALGTALGTKDEYTSDHAQALVGLTTNVARRLALAGPELRDITVAAALHDVGKIGVPATILAKPGPLTVEEWAVMRRHPELGAKIMEPVPALDGARRLVLACHEHWDGSGYPRGLAGGDIPLGARVILACDAFHAMTSDRVYRAAMPVADALAELRRCAGIALRSRRDGGPDRRRHRVARRRRRCTSIRRWTCERCGPTRRRPGS